MSNETLKLFSTKQEIPHPHLRKFQKTQVVFVYHCFPLGDFSLTLGPHSCAEMGSLKLFLQHSKFQGGEIVLLPFLVIVLSQVTWRNFKQIVFISFKRLVITNTNYCQLVNLFDSVNQHRSVYLNPRGKQARS